MYLKVIEQWSEDANDTFSWLITFIRPCTAAGVMSEKDAVEFESWLDISMGIDPQGVRTRVIKNT